jgi:hypothetical protein
LDQALVCTLIRNNPEIFRIQINNHQIATEIQCGSGWFCILDQLAYDLTALSALGGYRIFLTRVGKRNNELWVDWISSHELLNCEVAAVNEVILHNSIMSRQLCGVCGRLQVPITCQPLLSRCEHHPHDT